MIALLLLLGTSSCFLSHDISHPSSATDTTYYLLADDWAENVQNKDFINMSGWTK